MVISLSNTLFGFDEPLPFVPLNPSALRLIEKVFRHLNRFDDCRSTLIVRPVQYLTELYDHSQDRPMINVIRAEATTTATKTAIFST